MSPSSIRSASIGIFLLSLTSATALWAEVDVVEIIRRTVAADQRNWKVASQYGFSERVGVRRLDSHGEVKSTDVKRYDVTLVEGSPYRRLVERDDRPLEPDDERKERAKLTKGIATRQKETAAQRALRQGKYQNRPDWLREMWQELPDAFDFRLAADESRDGAEFYVIDATPRKEYRPHSRTAKILAQLQGRLWIDKRDYRLAKAEVEVAETIAVGLILVRLAKGSRATFEQVRLNEKVWLPRRVYVAASARLGLVRMLHIEHEAVFSECRTVTGTLVSKGPRGGLSIALE
ncbi:MAG: hypothetical protein IPM24_25595 [Bryobacterales bacterium]|nr:hypothetical protein [Bryobacterales bacterium]